MSQNLSSAAVMIGALRDIMSFNEYVQLLKA